jgi:hypothetical protein
VVQAGALLLEHELSLRRERRTTRDGDDDDQDQQGSEHAPDRLYARPGRLTGAPARS